MLLQFLSLQWRSFIRSASFETHLVLKILMAFMALYFIAVFSMLGAFSYSIIQEQTGADPLEVVNKIMIFYLAGDLVLRYMMQRMPVVNIKPLLVTPFAKGRIVHFALWKTVLSFFNIIHWFFFIPFTVVLIKEGYPMESVLGWALMMGCLFYANNFINVFLNDIDPVFYAVAGLFVVSGILMYYGIFDLSEFTSPFFVLAYDRPELSFVGLVWVVGLYILAFRYFKGNLYLDAGLTNRSAEATTEDYSWLNRFGGISAFLKNDLRLIRRNKRSRTTVLLSMAFLFYGMFFFTGAVEVYEGPVWRIFAGLFVTGGFLFTFGQYVPSWDSAYYPLMMSQNIPYRDYLNSKWWLVVIATVISTFLASFYLYYGWEVYLAIVVAAIYNIGVNSHMVLWGGAYVKTPIDLTSNKKAFGDKQAFNLQTMLLIIPKMVLPLGVYAAGHYTLGPVLGYILVALSGILGFAFKDKVFNLIEKVYKKEKYKTLAAYKQNK